MPKGSVPAIGVSWRRFSDRRDVLTGKPGLRRRGSVDPFKDLEDEPAEGGAGGQVNHVMLLREEATGGDQCGKKKGPGTEAGLEVERGQRGHGGVHAGETVGARVETLHEGQEPFGRSGLPVTASA